MKLSWGESVTSSILANVASTLAGIPITWGLLFVIELAVSQSGRAFGLEAAFTKAHAVTRTPHGLYPTKRTCIG